ncbi:MAG TPA: DNA replication and repair protein RecF [Patescibacteria group bacterium]|nr:DNA replication and repair protein RecF [Patescibacteria group bacterium]
MLLTQLKLTNFRSHKSSKFEFSPTTVIIGHNTAGKTNILESVYILSGGKSFRAHHDKDVIREGFEFSNIDAIISNQELNANPQPRLNRGQEQTNLKVIFSLQRGYLSKKFLVNNVARSQHNFTENFVSVLFTPHDIELITDSPGIRRKYIDSILYQADKNYRTAIASYDRALRHRNKMLYDMREGKKQYKTGDFEFFNNVLIEHGNYITAARQKFVDFVNEADKDIFDFTFYYDKSEMSQARLAKYHFEERAAGVTLVGPQRDDFKFFFGGTEKPVQEFGSRGEERLTIFQLKVLEVSYLLHATSHVPVLLLDDIFSELDEANIHKVFDLLPDQQTIITTTHHEFVPKRIFNRAEVTIIEL